MPDTREITLTGCAHHNLCDLDLSFPTDALIFVTGPSGAGKSSLVFGTLHAESRRRYLEGLSTAERSQLDQVAPPQLDGAENLPLTIGIRPDSIPSGWRQTVGTESGLLAPLQLLFATQSQGYCPACGHHVRTWQTHDILDDLAGLPDGTRLLLGFPFPQDASLADAADWLTAAGFQRVVLDGSVLSLEQLRTPSQARAAEELTVVVDRVKWGTTENARLRESLETSYRAGRGKCTIFAEVSSHADWQEFQLDGQTWSVHQFSRDRDCLACGRPMLDPVPALFRWTSPLGACPTCRGRGVVKTTKGRRTSRSVRSTMTCPDCDGTRLNPDARGYRLHGTTLPQLQELTVQQFNDWLAQHSAHGFLDQELQQRIEILAQLGLANLPLGLATSQLSDAERISIALASAVTEPLPGALYLIEEPFSGRQPEDWPAIVELLDQLRKRGAGTCLVQARADVLKQADALTPDRIFRLGPGAGAHGGRLVTQEETVNSLPESTERKPGSIRTEPILLRNISWPWMRENEITIIEAGITTITGPSATRPVALLREVLTPVLSGDQPLSQASLEIENTLPFDQALSLTVETRRPHPRQIVAAAVQAFGGIRAAVAETDDARKRNLTRQDLSLFNREGARCRRCEGTGRIGVDFDFLPEFELNCPECGGSRYESRVSDVRFRGLTLPEILDLTAEEAFRLFKGQHSIQRRLQLLKQVSLGYLRLGQSLTEMSQGERQRLRLAAALAKIRGARMLLLAEELSWGLASEELPSILAVLKEFTTAGHSVLLVDAHPFWEFHSDFFLKLSPAK